MSLHSYQEDSCCHRSCAVTALLLIAACSDRTVTPPSEAPVAPIAANAQRPEALAKMFAKGLKNPAFRAYLKAQLDASPYREHKLQFETFLGANGSRALSEIAVENGATKTHWRLSQGGDRARGLFPVPAHRAAWTGDEHVLRGHRSHGRRSTNRVRSRWPRQVLDPKTPPAIPSWPSCRSKPTSHTARLASSNASTIVGARSAAAPHRPRPHPVCI